MTITGTTAVAALEGDKIEAREIHPPEDAGLPVHPPLSAIMGGTPEENGVAFCALLDGEKSAYRDAVLLNAACALVVADKADNLRQGVEMASESIDSGEALRRIQTLAKVTSGA